MNLIEQITKGQGQTAVNEIKKALGRKLMEAIKTERVRVINEVYADEEIAEEIENPNTSGQGHDPDHTKHQYHDTILKHGYKYSHTTPIRRRDGSKYMHHTYTHPEHKDHAVSVGSTMLGNHAWEVGKIGGTKTGGMGTDKLDKFLKGHLARARKKAQ